MPISPNTKRVLIITGLLTVLIVSILLAIIPVLLERWINQYDLQSAFHKATGGTISTRAIKLRVFPAPHLIISAGKLDLPNLVSGRWREIRIHPAFKSILSGQIRFHKLKIIEPDVQLNTNLVPEDEGQTEVEMGGLTADHLHKLLMEASHQMGNGMQWLITYAPEARVRIRNGRLDLLENAAMPSLAFHDIDAQLTLPPDVLQIELDCKSNMVRTLRVAGAVDASTLTGQLTLWFKSLNAEQMTAITGLKRVDGMLSGHMTVDLKGPSKIESRLSFRMPQLLLQRLETPLTIRNAFIDGTAVMDETNFRFDLARLYAEQPRLNITGHVQVGGEFSGLRIHLVGSQIDVAEARQATLALVGDNESVVKIFDVLRAGNVPWISWRTEGPRIGDLAVFRNMKLTGEMQAGQLYIPGADLNLTEVNGIADIADGVLRGESLSARETMTTGQDGKLWMDFEPDDISFFLEIDTHLKDVGQLPPLLLKWVDNAPFQSELRRLSRVRGEARGLMILDSRKGAGLEVTADVAQCRLAARYDRIPWEIQIDKGLVQYTNDRIAVDQMSGRIGASTFANLKAHVDMEREPWLHIDSARAAVNLEAVIPWLTSQEALESVARRYRIGGDTAEIASLSLQGPFLAPSRWTYRVKSRIDRLKLEAEMLPGSMDFSDLQLVADEKSLTIESTGLKMLDAEVTCNGGTTYEAGRMQAFEIQFKGRVGSGAEQWLNDFFEEDADYFLTKSPLAVSKATITWADGKPYVGIADFTTSGGVQVNLLSEFQPGTFHKERVQVTDGEVQATLSQHRRSDQMALTFEGTLTGKTLDRLLLKNPFPSGRLKGDFQITIMPAQPARSTANGYLTVSNFRLPLEMEPKIHISQLQLTAEDNRLQIAPAAFLIDNNWHTLEGEITLASDRYHVDLRHEGAYFELPTSDEPQTEGEPSKLERVLNLPIDGKIQSSLSAFKWGEHRWVPIKTTTVMTPGQWGIKVDEVGLCGIQTTGTVVLELGKISFDLEHNARNKSLDPTLSCLLGKSDLIDGRFNLEGRLTGEAPIGALGESLNGHFKFEAEDGRIYRFDLLGRILAAINLTELVRGKKSDLMGEGLAYRQIEIEAQLQKSQLTLEKALIDGASAEIAAKGSLDLKADEIDLIVLVAPLKTIDAIVKFTPIINTWLEGTLVSIPVRVSGDIDDPRITPMSPKAVGSSLWNLLKNTVQLPIKLVEPLFDDGDDDSDGDGDSPPP